MIDCSFPGGSTLHIIFNRFHSFRFFISVASYESIIIGSQKKFQQNSPGDSSRFLFELPCSEKVNEAALARLQTLFKDSPSNPNATSPTKWVNLEKVFFKLTEPELNFFCKTNSKLSAAAPINFKFALDDVDIKQLLKRIHAPTRPSSARSIKTQFLAGLKNHLLNPNDMMRRRIVETEKVALEREKELLNGLIAKK
ncbi:hypothetical protein DSO57_1015473 [Entomophthora muscae]|uniref:Uncharacterized protein n=1 Tax=Entomophthora muscae TaxID=34485 RepID=A0ACC2TFS5_9FUNG|nr:hypothetical protein DSO57_1015473 [Entomophthora muscae]